MVRWPESCAVWAEEMGCTRVTDTKEGVEGGCTRPGEIPSIYDVEF